MFLFLNKLKAAPPKMTLFPAVPFHLRTAVMQMRYCFRTQASDSKVRIAAKHPFEANLEAEKHYSWCSCGYSKKQPFCDGSHKRAAPGLSPLRFTLEESKTVWLCGCKHTKTPPYCDGTHKQDFIQKATID
ncbi:CDGSH iron-sulfur domain-containing protein 3, mitochondrial [Latimeria chalumnae]|uniref:CDGSH iron sulfur domain 3 n=1 Tax=Latimeria chalumnae TaxID=7897 RepID=H2ZRL2_LATCH|nr:PREDICTED: CDGSH iron-sulfur domain-containing protein 3, mitochondrial [Latimeria chalumnae]|eukprot:XP_006014374.1 PREDICTED: CDGSH iron-sulfur domain-containing protein 3, mitochondrial [Latimeria chalumnae]